METVKPFNKEELRVFKEYCYTVFGLHFVGDVLNKHTVMDGDKFVHQVRQAAATIEQLEEIVDKVNALNYFVEKNGVVCDGFRTRELLLELGSLVKSCREFRE